MVKVTFTRTPTYHGWRRVSRGYRDPAERLLAGARGARIGARRRDRPRSAGSAAPELSVTDRRAFVGIVAGGLLLSPVVAHAQQPANKLPTLGILALAGLAQTGSSPQAAFFQGLRD